MSIPNNFYEIYQPKISVALKILGLQKYMKALNKVRKKYGLDLGLHNYQEDIIKEFLQLMREEL